jgi:hypothetical protein
VLKIQLSNKHEADDITVLGEVVHPSHCEDPVLITMQGQKMSRNTSREL